MYQLAQILTRKYDVKIVNDPAAGSPGHDGFGRANF